VKRISRVRVSIRMSFRVTTQTARMNSRIMLSDHQSA
jgi:hypothetical protein